LHVLSPSDHILSTGCTIRGSHPLQCSGHASCRPPHRAPRSARQSSTVERLVTAAEPCSTRFESQPPPSTRNLICEPGGHGPPIHRRQRHLRDRVHPAAEHAAGGTGTVAVTRSAGQPAGEPHAGAAGARDGRPLLPRGHPQHRDRPGPLHPRSDRPTAVRGPAGHRAAGRRRASHRTARGADRRDDLGVHRHARALSPASPRGGGLLRALVAGLLRVRLPSLGLADQSRDGQQAGPRGPDRDAAQDGCAAESRSGSLGRGPGGDAPASTRAVAADPDRLRRRDRGARRSRAHNRGGDPASPGGLLHRDGGHRALPRAGRAGVQGAGRRRVRHQRVRSARLVLSGAAQCAPHERRRVRDRGAGFRGEAGR
jgi:hypothetical protein